jgi:hypothetical protein
VPRRNPHVARPIPPLGGALTYWCISAAEAQKIADLNKAGEDNGGWTYVVSVAPNGSGKAIIKIYDEDGEFVANL